MSPNIGDRVQVTGTYEDDANPLIDDDMLLVGAIGTITSIDDLPWNYEDNDGNKQTVADPFPYLVEFDEPVADFADRYFNESELTKI